MDTDIFSRRETTLDDLAKAGWTIDVSGSGRTFFRHRSGSKHSLPEWVLECFAEQYKRGAADTQNAIRRALGMVDGK